MAPVYKDWDERQNAIKKGEIKKGEDYYHQGMREAEPFVNAVISPLVFMSGMKAPLWAGDLAFALSDPKNPFAYIPLFGKAWVGGNMALKRFGETGMRSIQGLALSDITPAVKKVWNQPGGKGRTASIAYYILTGNKMGQKGYYNSFSPHAQNYYTGFWTNEGDSRYIPEEEMNDWVDAFWFGKKVDPRFGVKYIGTGPENYGLHKAYVAENYPNKKIPVYELKAVDNKTVPEEQLNQLVRFYDNKKDSHLFWTYDDKGEPIAIDVGGHRDEIYISTDPVVGFKRDQDIWKFQPKEYKGKWFKHSGFRSKLDKLATNLALHFVDRLGTPIITRTKWQNIGTLPEFQLKEMPKDLLPIETVQKQFETEYLDNLNGLKALLPYIDDPDNIPESLWPYVGGNWPWLVEPSMRKQVLLEMIDNTVKDHDFDLNLSLNRHRSRVEEALKEVNTYNEAVKKLIEELKKKPAVPLKDVHK